jgi:hypothetical protein
MSIRQKFWGRKFGKDFSRLFAKLQDEKNDFCVCKLPLGR